MTKQPEDFWTGHGIKHTKQRGLVISLLEGLDKPISIEEIYTKAIALQPTINLSTIYRVLELFHSKDIVIKTISLESQKAFYELNHHEHRHYMVCVACQKVFPLEECPCNLIEAFIEEHTSFKMLEHKLEIRGYCPHCKDE